METMRTTEGRLNGLSIEDLSDLSGIDSDILAAKLAAPREFTLDEVAELAPHLGLTVYAFVGSVLS